MKNLRNTVSVLSVFAIASLVSCQKKDQVAAGPCSSESHQTVKSRSGNSVTTFSGQILGSSNITDPAVFNYRYVYALNGVTHASTGFYDANPAPTGYYGTGSYLTDVAIVVKYDNSPNVMLDYNLSTLDQFRSGGSAFLPEEIEMIGPATTDIYALKANAIYSVSGVYTSTVTATSIYTFPTTWAFYRKTICHSPTAGALTVFVAETGSAKGSTVGMLKQYTLSGLPGSPSLSALQATVALSYTNTLEFNSFSTATGGFSSNPYHIVLSDQTANTSAMYQLIGTAPTYTASAVTSFSRSVNDCSFSY